MTDVLDFAAEVWRPQDKGTSTFISLPFDVKALFGRARCPVRVTVNDHTWRTTTQVYGEEYRLVVNAEARAAAGIEPGDRVHVLVRKDDAIGVVELPAELAARLRSDPEARRPSSHSLPRTVASTPAGWRKPSCRPPGSADPRRPLSD